MGGMIKKSTGPAVQQTAAAVQEKQAAETKAAEAQETVREDAEDKSSRRRARRGGRALLSQARINPEQGVSTLGQTGL